LENRLGITQSLRQKPGGLYELDSRPARAGLGSVKKKKIVLPLRWGGPAKIFALYRREWLLFAE